MAGTTYSKFFWQDWVGDNELAMCSQSARGTWMGLLVVAARSTRPGHVLLNGKKPSLADLRQAIRALPSFTDEELQRDIDELVRTGTCDLTGDGVLVSRRIVRDTKRRQISINGGKSRQKQIAENKEESLVGSRRFAQQGDSATISHQPSTTSQQPAADARSSKEKTQDDLSRMAKLEQALGQNLTHRTNAFAYVGQMISLEADGIDIELDLFPMLSERRDGGKLPSTWKSLSYFRDAALEFRASRLAKDAMEGARVTHASERPRADWEPKLRGLLLLGYWRDDGVDGPSPFEPNCLVPADMLERARTLWNRQGQVPSDDSQHLHYVKRPTPFWGDNVVALPARTG